MRDEQQCRGIDAGQPGAQRGDADARLENVDLGVELPARERALYARYVRALALLCECAPYVDEPDYVDLIDELLADACRTYPLTWCRDGEYRQIAVGPAPPG